jgi:hypothetical protein
VDLVEIDNDSGGELLSGDRIIMIDDVDCREWRLSRGLAHQNMCFKKF